MSAPTHLVVVESPAKATTIEGYLARRGDGRRWIVRATKGHVCDLPHETLGIDNHHGRFTPQWRVPQGSRQIIDGIKTLAASAERVYIATDPDREGEKIASDIIAYAKLGTSRRIFFTEITERSVNTAIDHQTAVVNEERVDAQVARRLVDREIGYPISDVIYWSFKQAGAKEMPRGIGRVISPALRILCAAEEKIEAFIPQTYWRIAVDYTVGKIQFRLLHDQKYMAEDWEVRDETLSAIATGKHVVANYKPQTKETPPYPPLTTARLQRLAFYLLDMAPEETMRLAQQLYEGVDLQTGRHGLITYPRTDSVQLCDQAAGQIIEVLGEAVDDELILRQKRRFKNRENAQAAHEAIRPARFDRAFWPSEVARHVSKEAYELYNLIWLRTLQTQMLDSVYDCSLIEVDCAGHILKGRAHQRIFVGWEELDGGRMIAAEENEEEAYRRREITIPRMHITDPLETAEVRLIELDTTRPQRFGIGRFLTTLDGNGIARPSTLDTVVPALSKKGYVTIRHGMLYPANLGRLIDDWTVEYASWLGDPEHAKHFEDALDSVERGETDRNVLIAAYVKRIDALKETLGYVAKDHDRPTPEALAYAERLAAEQGVNLPAEAGLSAGAVSRFINAHRPERDVIGKCPACGDKSITVYEKLYGCASRSCDFKLWISDVERFIAAFSIQQAPNALVRELLRRKRTLYEELTKKGGGHFPAYLAIRARADGKAWEVKIDGFPRANRRNSETEY